MTEGRKGGWTIKIKPGPLLSSKSDPTTTPALLLKLKIVLNFGHKNTQSNKFCAVILEWLGLIFYMNKSEVIKGSNTFACSN